MPIPLWISLTPALGFVLQLGATTVVPAAPPAASVDTIEVESAPAEHAIEAETIADDPVRSGALDLATRDPATSDEESLGTGSDAGVDVAAALRRRAHIGRIHRIFGMSTFVATTGAVVFGTLQYANLYGLFDPVQDTRCVRGNAFFGQDACTRTPIPHLVTSMGAGILYYTTFGLSYAMPDPIGLDIGSSESARRLRIHKRLRFAHFAGMTAQMLFGFLIANSERLGLDRSNDYRTLQGLATAHLLIGYATYGTLTYAGALMAF